jgi:hypothetical protein
MAKKAEGCTAGYIWQKDSPYYFLEIDHMVAIAGTVGNLLSPFRPRGGGGGGAMYLRFQLATRSPFEQTAVD